MKKEKIILSIVIFLICIFVSISKVSAGASLSYNFKLRQGEIPVYPVDNGNYKYAIVEFDASGSGKTTMSYFRCQPSGSIMTTSLGKGTFSLKTHNKVYILPKSGMKCPADATYCFGAGISFSSTTITYPDYPAYGIKFEGGDSEYSGTLTFYE